MTNSNESNFTSFNDIKDRFSSDALFTVKELSETAFQVTSKGRRKMNVIVYDEAGYSNESNTLLSFNISSNAARILSGTQDFPSVALIEEWITGEVR